MTECITSSRHTTGGLRILIIGNSFHHSKNLLFLVSELVRRDPTIRATLVCSEASKAKFAELVANSVVNLVSFEQSGIAKTTISQPSGILEEGFTRRIRKGTIEKLASAVESVPKLKKPLKKVIATLKRTTPGLYLRECRLITKLKHEKHNAEQLFDQLEPNLIIAFGDRHPDFEAPIQVVAQERGIKVVIPYTTYSGKDILVEVRKNEIDFSARRPFSLYRWQKARYFKKQLHEELFYQPPNMLAGYEKFGSLSSYPWCLGNGRSDIICVDSEVTADRYKRDRVPPEKIRITGDIVYDKIAQCFHRKGEIKAELLTKYCFDEKCKIIIIALPQLAEQGVMDWEPHWKEIRFLVEQTTLSNQNVLLSLHPRMNTTDYTFLEKEFPCRIAQERLSEIIAGADVFIANYSSTVIWSILCGIKTLVVDFYGLNYRFFDYLTSVSIVRQRENFPATLSKVIEAGEVDFTIDWKALSRHVAFDGRTIERYHDLFIECANASAKRIPNQRNHQIGENRIGGNV